MADARIAELYENVQECASAAGLVYVSDEQPGIRRRAYGRGFAYRDASSRPVTDDAVKARIAALAIPPAWRNVWICPDDDGHIRAVGEDDRGRKQYIYHERWRELRDLLNFYRLISFGEQLPTIRAEVAAQLRRRTPDRQQVLATMLRIVDVAAIRIGSEVYAEENQSFGLSTLTKKHVSVTGDEVRMTFPAKSGKRADVIVRDRQVARVVTKLEQHRARRLFTVDKETIDASEVNDLLFDLTGEHITAKDFRTWRGTVTAFAYLEKRVGDCADRQGLALEAVDAAAQVLGNTRAVARAHYVHPQLINAVVDETFADYMAASRPRRHRLLDGVERRLLGFLDVAFERDVDVARLGARV